VRRLIGFAAHRASVALHCVARRYFDLQDEYYDDHHIEPDFALREKCVPVIVDGCQVDGEYVPEWGVALADVAPEQLLGAARVLQLEVRRRLDGRTI
jgi:hypothetical protein